MDRTDSGGVVTTSVGEAPLIGDLSRRRLAGGVSQLNSANFVTNLPCEITAGVCVRGRPEISAGVTGEKPPDGEAFCTACGSGSVISRGV